MIRTRIRGTSRGRDDLLGRGGRASLFALLTLPAIVNGATVRVPSDQPTIQAGIDAAARGDTVLVAAGIYAGPGNKDLDLRGKDLEVRSEDGPQVTVVDCESVGRGFFLLGPYTAAAIIRGFTIRHGNSGADPVGGGAMFIAGGAPSIIDCIFEQNRAAGNLQNGGGGAISVYNASPSIARCLFLENTAGGNQTAGGALALHRASGRITDCSFVRNTVPSGGGGGIGVGMFGTDPVDIQNCDFSENQAQSGGGAALVSAKVTGCRFSANTANHGGGAYVLSTEWSDCIVTGNAASGFGGGCAFYGSTMSHCVVVGNEAPEGGGLRCDTAVVTHSVIARNVAVRGGGVAVIGQEPTRFLACTISDNEAPSGSGVYLTSFFRLTHFFENTIISAGRDGEAIQCAGNARAELSCSDVFGNEGGDWVRCIEGQRGVRGNLAADPRFCGSTQMNFTLAANSPCLPGNHPQGVDCGVIGALGEGCPPATVQERTWGAIKARFRE